MTQKRGNRIKVFISAVLISLTAAFFAYGEDYTVSIPPTVSLTDNPTQFQISGQTTTGVVKVTLSDSLNDFELVYSGDSLDYTLKLDSATGTELTEGSVIFEAGTEGVTKDIFASYSGTPIYAGDYEDTLTFSIESFPERMIVKTPPTKKEYFPGESFAPAGMVFTITEGSISSDIAYNDYPGRFTIAYPVGQEDEKLVTGDNIMRIVYTNGDFICNCTYNARAGYYTHLLAGSSFRLLGTHTADTKEIVFCTKSSIGADPSGLTELSSAFMDSGLTVKLYFSGWPTNIAYVCADIEGEDVRMKFNSNSSQMFYWMNKLEHITIKSDVIIDTTDMTNCSEMFEGCGAYADAGLSLADINTMLSYFDTSNVTDMHSMFKNTKGVSTACTELDLSSFDTGKVTNMTNMFYGQSGFTLLFTKIYVGSLWTTENVTSSGFMFDRCDSLVGEFGTVFSSSNPQDKTYAHLDHGTSNPGYFSTKVPVVMATLTYDVKGGIAGSVTEQECIQGEYVVIPAEASPVKSGFLFDGWSESSEAVSVDYNVGDSVTLNSDKTLYAVYEPASTVAITYDANTGVSGTTTSQIVIQGESITIPETANPTKEGLSFMGWAESASATEVDYHVGDTIVMNADLTVYAVYRANTTMLLAGESFRGLKGYQSDVNHIVFCTNDSIGSGELVKKDNFYVTGSGVRVDLYWRDADKTAFVCADVSGADVTMRFNPNSGDMFCLNKLESVTVMPDVIIDTSDVTDFHDMFVICGRDGNGLDLDSISDLVSRFDTGRATTMEYMFQNMTNITKGNSLDLSSFDTSRVTTTFSMFSNTTSLVTIYVSDKWVPTPTISYGMFYGCTGLVGGNGTVYSASHTTSDYAHVDAPGNPGYLTLKP